MASDQFIKEGDVPEDWQSVEAAPITPSRVSIPFPSSLGAAPPLLGNMLIGTLPTDIQHDGIFVRTGYQTAFSPRAPLVPVGDSGIPSINSAIINNNTTVVTPTTTSTLTWAGVWNSSTVYQVDDLVLSNSSLYLAIMSNVGTEPDTDATKWVLWAENLVFGASFTGTYFPYWVKLFRGSMFVCLNQTTLDAFADPTNWALIAQGAGSTVALGGTHVAVAADWGRLIYNNTASNYAITLSATPFVDGWWAGIQVLSTGTVTINPNGKNLNGSASSLVLAANQGVYVYSDGSNYFTFKGFGTVYSVALSMPSIFTTAGSPITTSGTFVVSLNTETANTIFAGPTSGIAAIPTFRALVAADLPAGTGTVTSVGLALPVSVFTISGSPVTTSGTLTGSFATQAANTIFAGPTSGAAATPAFRTLVAADFLAASANLTTQTANVAATTIVSTGTNAGLYRVTVYTVVSQAASTTSTLPDSQIIFTDRDSSATITANLTSGDSGNTTSTFAQATFIVNANASTNIQYAIGQVTAYASSGGTPMQFAYRIRVEFLG